jgi:hypothetical protein
MAVRLVGADDRPETAVPAHRILVFTTAREPNAPLATMLRDMGCVVIELCGAISTIDRLVGWLMDLDAAVLDLGQSAALCWTHMDGWRRAGWTFPIVAIADSRTSEAHARDATSVVLGREASPEMITGAVARLLSRSGL